MSFTLQNIADEARAYLRDTSAKNWDDTLMLKLINDAIQGFRKIIGNRAPEILITSGTISISISGSYGPYNLATTVERVASIINDYDVPLSKTGRAIERPTQATGKPSAYWLEGYNPVSAYFDVTPDASYTYKYYYIPMATRAVALSESVPMPDFIREVLKDYIVKVCGQIDEYATMDEDSRLSMITPFIDSILNTYAGEIAFTVEGLEF